MTSTHKCEVIEVKLETHPYADTLSLVRPFGYSVCVRTRDWQDGNLGAYVVPDSLVDTDRDEFKFLPRPSADNPWHHVKVMKLRQIYSQGLLIPAPLGARVGDDVAETLGIKRYEPDPEVRLGFETGPEQDRCPQSAYDLESYYRYAQEVLVIGEPLFVTEKIDGSNVFFLHSQGRMWASSRNGFQKYDPGSPYWQALYRVPGIEAFCQENPGYRLYGEVFGNSRKMPYGSSPGIQFAAFDIRLPSGTWLPPEEARGLDHRVPWAPVIGEAIPYDFQSLIDLANGKSLTPGAHNVREGIVVEPVTPRQHLAIGRVKLKIVSNQYLCKS